MTDEAEEDLAEVKMLVELLLEKEQGAFRIIRKRRADLDDQRRRLQHMAGQARTNAGAALADIPVLLTYLKALAVQVARLNEECEALIVEEQSQKENLKIALGRQLRLDDSEN